MKIHIAISTKNLEKQKEYYSKLFEEEPDGPGNIDVGNGKTIYGYLWILDYVHFVLLSKCEKSKKYGLDHLGIIYDDNRERTFESSTDRKIIWEKYTMTKTYLRRIRDDNTNEVIRIEKTWLGPTHNPPSTIESEILEVYGSEEEACKENPNLSISD